MNHISFGLLDLYIGILVEHIRSQVSEDAGDTEVDMGET
jgi:hypothetical protein